LTLDCLQDVRRSVAALRASSLEELAIEESLQRLVADFADSTGLTGELRATLADDVTLESEVAQAVYRAVQEGLTNIQRHAHANRVCVSLDGSREQIVLTVDHNGGGPAVISNGHGGRSTGFSLIGLRERVALLDGQLDFGPGRRGGSRLRIELPTRSLTCGRGRVEIGRDQDHCLEPRENEIPLDASRHPRRERLGPACTSRTWR
jgi:signal transduction histidine kinase